MACYRQIHTHIWKDEWFLDLDADEKLLFIYLFSNELTSVAGIYKIPLKVIVFETGLDKAFVTKTLAKFAKAGKAYYEDGIAWVVNLRKYNESSSSKLQTRIETDLSMIPDGPLKERYTAHAEGENTLSENENTLSEISAEQDRTGQDRTGHDCVSPPDGGGVCDKAHKDKVRGNLETYFSRRSGLDVPKRATVKQKAAAAELWWSPLREIAELAGWDEDAGMRLISDTLAEMQGQNLRVIAPKSILNVAKSIHAEKNRVEERVVRFAV